MFPLPAGLRHELRVPEPGRADLHPHLHGHSGRIIGLGRPLSGGTTTVQNIPLVAPQTLFEDRVTRLDLRLSHSFQVQRVRVQLNLDAYNALNANSVRAVNSGLHIGVNLGRSTN